MSNQKNYTPKSNNENLLAEVVVKVKTKQEALNLLRDLLTPKELEEFGKRIAIAKILENSKLSYLEIAKKMKTSTTTVTRVALWLNNGCGGYKKVLGNPAL